MTKTAPPEPQTEGVPRSDLLRMAGEIVAVYVGRNTLPPTQIPELIVSVFNTLSELGQQHAPAQGMEPAVPIRKSVTPDHIVCLEDGKKLKMLKRYLRSTYGLSPEEYRNKWNLPTDYPMVAPNYAKRRSEFAKKSGLGKGAKRG